MKVNEDENMLMKEYSQVSEMNREFRYNNELAGGSSAQDTINNLLTMPQTLVQLIGMGERITKEKIKQSLDELSALREYFQLLNEFPVYSFQERSGHCDIRENSAFPHIKRIYLDKARELGFSTPNVAYVHLSKELLVAKRGYLIN